MNFKNKKSLSEIIGIILPAIIVAFMNLYEIIFQPLSKYTLIITSILLLFILFNIGLREIIKKNKFGYFILIFVVILSIRVIIKYL